MTGTRTCKDLNGETLSVQGLAGSASAASVTTQDGDTIVTFTPSTTFNNIKSGDELWWKAGTDDWRAVYDSDGNHVTATGGFDGNNQTIPLSGFPDTYYDGSGNVDISTVNGEVLGIKDSTDDTTLSKTAGLKTGTAESARASTIDLDSPDGVIAEEMSVSGNGIPDGTTISSVTHDSNGVVTSIGLDKAVTSTTSTTGTDLSFSAASGSTVRGQHGELTLNADGGYVYTPTIENPDLSEGESARESFDYTAQDAAGASADGVLNITVLGSGTNDPNAENDSATAVEDGGTTPSGDLLANDTTPGGTGPITIVSARSTSDSGSTAVSTDTQISGQYGTLTVSDGGSYTYAVDNNNSSVQALHSASDTLTDEFSYTIENGETNDSGDPLIDTAGLSVTIEGSNDAPVAVNDQAEAREASGVNNNVAGIDPSGNVLDNDTDVDDPASALEVTAVDGNSVADGTTSADGTEITGQYGTLTLGADGSYSYVVDNDNSTVNDLADGETLSEAFTYTVKDGSGTESDTGALSITIEGANDTIDVNNSFVNEASPYAMFTVNGAQGIDVSLALSDSDGLASSDTKATLGADADLSNQLEYFDGGWKAYDSDNPPAIPADNELLVRTAVNPDDIHEGNEAFSLTASTTGNDSSTVTGIGTISDESEGDIFLADNNTGTPNDPADDGYPAELDDDRPTVSITDTTVTEGGNAEFTVNLDKTSTRDISFNPALESGTATIGTDTAGNSAIEISKDGGSTWSTLSDAAVLDPGQDSLKLRIATVDDATQEDTETFTLSTGYISGFVTNQSGVSGTGTVTDNDTAGITASAISGNTGEDGTSASFSVQLDSKPTNDVTIAVASSDTSEGTVKPTTLTFTPTDWDSAQDVTVTGADDDQTDGNIDYSVDLTASSSDTNYDGKTDSVAVTNEDDDNPGLTVSDSALSTSEDGTTDSFTVRLNTQPTDSVTVDVVSGDTGEGSVDQSQLTFDASNWDQQQTVTVSGADDDQIDGNIDYSVDLSASSDDNNYDGESTSVAVTNEDDDTAGLAISGDTDLTTSEDGSTDSFSIRLNSQPTDTVTINVGSKDTGEGTVDNSQLTFDTDNWNQAQTVTVSGVDDDSVDGDVGYDLTLNTVSNDSNYDGRNVTTTVINEDNDTADSPDSGDQPNGEPDDQPDDGPSDNPGNGPDDEPGNGGDDEPGTGPDDEPGGGNPPGFGADLDPEFDTGEDNTDRVTNVIDPEFQVSAPEQMTEGDTAVLLGPDGNEVGRSAITAEDVAAGNINIPTEGLDDGTYTFTAQLRDAEGNIKGESPVSVTVVTDLDGIVPSIERGANGGDFNNDGLQDWDQNNIAQFPVTSAEDFEAGTDAPESSFGALLAGDLPATDPGGSVTLNPDAQLQNIELTNPPAPPESDVTSSSDVFQFSITGQEDDPINDIAPDQPGTQTRVVLDLPQGVEANDYLKWDEENQEWFSFLDDQDLSTYDEGATLLDRDEDGLTDRVVLTLTDGGPGDADGSDNGIIDDPGMLALRDEDPDPVFSVLLENGDRYYTTDADEAAEQAAGKDNVLEGALFDSLDAEDGGQQLSANYNTLTGDWYFAAEDEEMPYLCYEHDREAAGFSAAGPDASTGQDFHLFMNQAGITQLLTPDQAAERNLTDSGFEDFGAIFNTTRESAFQFDPEGFLIENQQQDSIVEFVDTLADRFDSTSDAGFVDAVEQHFLDQVELLGIPQGGSAGASDLNAAFGTDFIS